MPVNDSPGMSGFRALSKQLEALGPAVGGKVLRSAAMSSTLSVVKEARARIPVSPEGTLVTTYKGRKVSSGFAQRNIKRASRLSRDKSTVWVRIGVEKEAYYAVHFVEVGTSRQPAQPWLEPAFRAESNSVIRVLGEKLKAKMLQIARKSR